MIKNQSYEFLKGYENNHINIGFGSYGQVKLARNTQTKELVAIKLIYNKNAKDEIAVHTRLDHPNIIKLLNYYYQKEKNVTYMVLEYADGGTLFEKLKTSHMSKEIIRKIYREVCQAVLFLHRNNFMHRDVKPENILLTKKNEAKLCDFGFAALMGQRKTLCGTYEYMGPEMIQNMNYDYRIDIWALGILLFEMIEGTAPFRGQSPEQVLSQMKKNIYFSDRFDKQEINLIKSILRVNPGNRPSVAQILEHKYFEKERQKSMSTFASEEQCKIKLISVTTIPQKQGVNKSYSNQVVNQSSNQIYHPKVMHDLIYNPTIKTPSHFQINNQPFQTHHFQQTNHISRPISSTPNFVSKDSGLHTYNSNPINSNTNGSFQNWRRS